MSNPYDNFFIKAKEKYGDRFIYHWDTYTRARDKMSITDTISGITFLQAPGNHLNSLPKEIPYERKTAKKDSTKALNKLIEWHPNIDFSNSIYINASGSITAICKKHGEFTKRYSDFNKDSGCPKCGYEKISRKNKLTQENFINKAKNISPNLDFSKTIYINALTNFKVICPIHGEFETNSTSILRGIGCKECNKSNNKVFQLNKLKELHSEYDFSNSIYISAIADITYICPIHGKQTTKAGNLLSGNKCNECSYTNRSSLTQQEFIERFSRIENKHNLDLSKAVYINTDTPIIVKCPVHGEFEKTPKLLLQNFICNNCNNVGFSQPELDIIEYIKSLGITNIIHTYKPNWLNGKHLDIYLPDYNLAIEYNGSMFHHSSESKYISNYALNTRKPKNYHYDKWLKCFENNVTLLSIFDFFWKDENKQEIFKSKIKHYLKLDQKIYARKCIIIKDIDKEIVKDFLNNNHLEGYGFSYKDPIYYGMYYNNQLIMVAIVGQYYNQTSKTFKYKLQRICTLKYYTVVGGISKLSKTILKDIDSFSYQITLMTGGSSLRACKSYRLIQPRYFWVNPHTLEYYYRNTTQKGLLKKNFKQPILNDDTENTYMERLGYLKIYDNGLAELNFN